jgi:hypothetical protein
MKKFEYKTQTLSVSKETSNLTELLDEEGNDGWELIECKKDSESGFDDFYDCIFKRELT